MFDSRRAYALSRELLAMTPGTDQFAARLRAITVGLDAEQARLGRAVDEAGRHVKPDRHRAA